MRLIISQQFELNSFVIPTSFIPAIIQSDRRLLTEPLLKIPIAGLNSGGSSRAITNKSSSSQRSNNDFIYIYQGNFFGFSAKTFPFKAAEINLNLKSDLGTISSGGALRHID